MVLDLRLIIRFPFHECKELESRYKERSTQVNDGANKLISGLLNDNYNIITLMYTKVVIWSVDENDIAIE